MSDAEEMTLAEQVTDTQSFACDSWGRATS